MLVQQIYNCNHQLRDTHLFVRAIYIIPAFILVLFSRSVAFNCWIILAYFSLIKLISKASLKHLIKLFSIPLAFLFIGCVTIAVSFSRPFSVEFTPEDTLQGLFIFSKSFALISVLFLGLMTYTISEMAHFFQKLRVPSLFIELFVLMYRFNMKLLQNIKQLYLAQKCRLGYTQRKNVYCHIGLLFATVFQCAIKSNKTTEIAMKARLATHQYQFVGPANHFKLRTVFPPVFLALSFSILYIVLNF